jgi:hypothetical protein
MPLAVDPVELGSDKTVKTLFCVSCQKPVSVPHFCPSVLELDSKPFEPNLTVGFSRGGTRSSVPSEINGRRSKAITSE